MKIIKWTALCVSAIYAIAAFADNGPLQAFAAGAAFIAWGAVAVKAWHLDQ